VTRPLVRLLFGGAVALGAVAAHAQGAAVTPAGASVPAKAAVCAACHSAEATAAQPLYPILAGQTARYLYLELRDFKAGRRTDPIMSPMAASLTPEEMQSLADYYSKQTPPVQTFKVDAEKAHLGKIKADQTLCTMCHLGGFKGQNEIPRVAGQNYAYIVKQLKAFKNRTRTNDAGSMTSVATTLSAADIENLAQYLVGL
jgi:cytochrome c553